MAIFHSIGIETSRLGGTIVFNYLLQAVAASVAIPLKTTVFYDLVAASGFISTAAVSSFWPNFAAIFRDISTLGLSSTTIAKGVDRGVWDIFAVLSLRQVVMGGMIVTWAIRFGGLMGHRMIKHGEDARFDEIKIHPKVFAGAFTGQATWVMVSSLPFWLVNTIPLSHQPGFGTLLDLVGVAVWIAGFALEILADHQKLTWRAAKDARKHDEKFITSGLWNWSRHPNYAGEIILWAGLPLLAATPLLANFGSSVADTVRVPGYYLVLACGPPIFEYFALAYATGVPPLEEIAEKKWGNESSWKEYKHKVPVLFGWPLGSK